MHTDASWGRRRDLRKPSIAALLTWSRQPGPPQTTKTSQGGALAKSAWASTVTPPARRTGPVRSAIRMLEIPGRMRLAIETTPAVPPRSIGSTPS